MPWASLTPLSLLFCLLINRVELYHLRALGRCLAEVWPPLPSPPRFRLRLHYRPTSHPGSSAPQRSAPLCQQYMDYVKAQVSDTKRKVEQISEELKSLDEMLAGNEGADGTVEVTAEECVFISCAWMSVSYAASEETEDADFWEGVTKPGKLKSTTSQQDNEYLHLLHLERFNFKIITDPADLMKFVQHLKESNRKVTENQAKSREEKPTGDTDPGMLRGEEKDGDERLLEEFEEEMADLSVPSGKIEEIKEEMQKEFDNIIDEAQQELETEGLKGEFDRTQATQALETTLDKLLDHLEEKDVQDPEQQELQRARDPSRGSPSLAPKQPGNIYGGVKPWAAVVMCMCRHHKSFLVICKIEVKILTRKNAEEAGDQWLTEEDTKSFRELLINLLTGGTEEVYKEQKRQQELENNYRFVWGESQEDTQSSSSTSDSDDVDI
uniref:OS9 endoplasmic reticulum lectin n=1 Tax=Fundulus heteroclitus TaxID=8078 RepID=A0A3Q2QNI2_FUNHE